MSDPICPDCNHLAHNHNNASETLLAGCNMAQCNCTNTPRMIRVTAERDAYRAALEWYADENNWKRDVVDIGVGGQEIPLSSEIDKDDGKYARAALEKVTK